eukprot:gene9988-10143_t
MLATTRLAVVIALLSLHQTFQAHGAFLQNELPLTVVLATPSELLDASTKSISVSSDLAFLAVFSRPVIALGSDFGQEQLPESMMPFKINCAVPGLFRWVTTNIARWDPMISWPTDLDCSFQWNTKLKTFDGATLQLSSPQQVALTSRPISFSISSVSSKKADELTDNQWNAYKGLDDDQFPEVPPDANITLNFDYPVILSVLKNSLKALDCCKSTAGSRQSIKVLPCAPSQVDIDPFASAEVFGLRRFRIPLRDNFKQLVNASDDFDNVDQGVSYRRLTMWLPHGLAAGTTAQQIKAQMWFCQYAGRYDWSSKCNAVPFTLEIANKGQLLMTVPTLAAREHYQLRVYGNAGSRAVKDGFGLPLEDSKAYFFTQDPSADISMPALASSSAVMLLEPAAGAPRLDWPVCWRGSPQWSSSGRGLAEWNVGSSNLITFLTALNGGFRNATVLGAELGPPGQSVNRTLSQYTTFESLMLSGKPGMQYLAMPTTDSYSPQTSRLLLVQSDLQYAAISIGAKVTHIVTQTTPTSAPIAGAKVTLYLIPYYDDEQPKEGPACTTAPDGTCTVDATPLYAGSYGKTVALVGAAGHASLVVWDMPTPDYYTNERLSYPYVGHLVLDRLVVNPADQLHVTGFVQERPGALQPLVLPTGLDTVRLTISPNWKPGAEDSPLSFDVKLNVSYGSLHLVIPVPADAKPGDYAIVLEAPKSKSADAVESTDLSSVDFTIGNPRPPTAVLNVTAPSWAPPGSTVKVYIQASSYLGADVSNAPMTLSWVVPETQGTIKVTTDSKGKAIAYIPLDKLPEGKATKLGDSLTISVEWIGPTRERIKETKIIRIENGSVRVRVTRSPTTDLPGVPFIMSAQTLLNNEDLTQLEGVTVEVSLQPNDTRSLENCSAAAAALVAQQRCRIISGKLITTNPCIITMPCAADYKLVACALTFENGSAVVGAGSKGACSETPLGRNTTAWQNQPWSKLPSFVLLKDRQNYTVGSTATLAWANPYWRPATGFLMWGNGRKQQQKLLSNVPIGPGSTTITVDSDYVTLNVVEDNRLNVSVKVVPAESANVGMPPGLFAAAHKTPDGRVVQVMRSNTEAEIEVKVTDFHTGKPAADAEVTVVVVDEAILSLRPYPLPDVAADIVSYPDVSSFIKEINDMRASRANINITFSTLERRLALDPWLPLVTTITPSTYTPSFGWGTLPTYPSTSVVDVPDVPYLRGFTNALTVTPFYSWGLSQRYPSGSKGQADPGAALRLSGEFKTVPVFAILKATTDGSATVRFKAPANLGTFNVRAYAVSKGVVGKSSKYGANETQVIVRQPLSLVGSVPLSARVDDDFEAGVIVSAPDAAKPFQVEITAQVMAANQVSDSNATAVPDGSLVLQPTEPVSSTITLSPDQQQVEVRFRYKAKAIGASGLRWIATLDGMDKVADALQQDVTVLGQQPPVFVATSFSLQTRSNITGRNEGVVLPQATPGSGSVSILAGIGYLPAIQASYDSLVQQHQEEAANSDTFIPPGTNAVNLALLPALLARYSAANSTDLKLDAAQLNVSIAAAKALSKLTFPNLGLLYYRPIDSDYLPSSASVILNSWAAWLVADTSQPVRTPTSVVVDTLTKLPYASALKTHAAVWVKVLAEQLVKNAQEAHRPPRDNGFRPVYVPPLIYDDYDELSWARLALGPGWSPPADLDPAVAADLALTKQVAAALAPSNTTLGCKARTGLVLTQIVNGQAGAGVSKAEAVTAIADLTRQMLGRIRVSGRTAYFAANPASASAASNQDQAFALLFLAPQNLPNAKEVLPKVAAYVAGGTANIASGALAATCVPIGSLTTGSTASGLSLYDAVQGSTSPDAKLNVVAVSSSSGTNSLKLLSASFKPGGPSLVNSTTPWGDLPPQPQLSFNISGSAGEVSVVAGLDFTPAKLLPFPSYRGLWVERVIQTEAGQGNVAAASLADVVTVTVQLTSPDDLKSVVVEVQMPSGLEPIDPKIYRDPAASTVCGLGGSDSSFSSWWCPAQSTLRSVVTFTFNYLWAGTVNIKFKAIAATPGRFVLPPVKAYAVPEPELMGLSAAGNFTVCPTRRGANAATATAGVAKTPGALQFPECGADGVALQPPLPVPKSCPGNGCSGNGVCNLADGKCLCNANFAGDACDKYAASRK